MKRIPMKGGDEQDQLTGWRHLYHRRPGDAKAAKRSYARRLRKRLKKLARMLVYEDPYRGEE